MADIRLKDLITEGNITPYLEKHPNGRSKSNISLVLGRNMNKHNAWYGLRTDTWFRKYFDPGKDFGIQIRKFKVTGTPKWAVDDNGVAYPVAVSYLPLQFDDPDDDVKSNWKHFRGYLVIGRDIKDKVSGSDVEKFVNSNLKKYIP